MVLVQCSLDQRIKLWCLFSILQPLLSLSENLLVQLRSRMEAWDERCTKIGDIFVHTVRIKQLYPVWFPHCTLPHSHTVPCLIPRPPVSFPDHHQPYSEAITTDSIYIFFYSGWPLEVVCELCKAAPSWTPGSYLANLHLAIASTIEVCCPVAADCSRVFLHRFWQKFLLKRSSKTGCLPLR